MQFPDFLRFGHSLVIFVFLALLVMTGSGARAQSGPPDDPSRYPLVWEDYFQFDTTNPGGELQNILGSSSAPDRPDWMYRAGTTLNCALQQSKDHVFVNASTSAKPGLILRDTADTAVNGYYTNYKCGGVETTRWFRYGYYETKADLSTTTDQIGFHTSFWMWGYPAAYKPYASSEFDIFEMNSNPHPYGSLTFSHGHASHNVVDAGPTSIPYRAGSHNHPPIYWNQHGGTTTPHIFGMLVTPKGMKFYLDNRDLVDLSLIPGPDASNGSPLPGAFGASNIWLSSVGSPFVGTGCTVKGPCLAAPGPTTFDFQYSYVKVYQPLRYNWSSIAHETVVNNIGILPMPPDAVILDTDSGSANYSSTGTWYPYVAKFSDGGPDNPKMRLGPQGFRGQNVKTSTVAGNTAKWSYMFPSNGSYDVYIWNASNSYYEDSGRGPHPDAASLTMVEVTGDINSVATANVMAQGTSGHRWVPVHQNAAKLYPTNTYLFAAGSTAAVTLTVGAEAADAGGVKPHTNADSVAFVPVHTLGVQSNGVGDSYTEGGLWIRTETPQLTRSTGLVTTGAILCR
jgi:hypothetical protein